MTIIVKTKIENGAKIPFKTHDSDFCYDIIATKVTEIHKNVYEYETGLSFQINRQSCPELNNNILSLDIRPRSSIKNTGLILSNSEATIDEDFTGSVKLIFYHVITDLPIYKVGDKIGQLKIGITYPIIFKTVDHLEETVRGNGGFGSTGK